MADTISPLAPDAHSRFAAAARVVSRLDGRRLAARVRRRHSATSRPSPTCFSPSLCRGNIGRRCLHPVPVSLGSGRLVPADPRDADRSRSGRRVQCRQRQRLHRSRPGRTRASASPPRGPDRRRRSASYPTEVYRLRRPASSARPLPTTPSATMRSPRSPGPPRRPPRPEGWPEAERRCHPHDRHLQQGFGPASTAQVAHVVGIAKGSGMIAPDMATMLAFRLHRRLPSNRRRHCSSA